MKELTTVNNLGPDFQFVVDSQDVQAVKEHFGPDSLAADYDSFFVKIENGDYVAVYGMSGIVPYLSKLVRLVS